MAKSKSMERGGKSAAIREYLKANPDARVQEVVDGLKKQGVAVSTALVNNIKYTKKKPGKRGRKPGKAKAATATNGTAAASAGDSVSLKALIEAKKVADQLGGVSELQKAAAALARLQQ